MGWRLSSEDCTSLYAQAVRARVCTPHCASHLRDSLCQDPALHDERLHAGARGPGVRLAAVLDQVNQHLAQRMRGGARSRVIGDQLGSSTERHTASCTKDLQLKPFRSTNCYAGLPHVPAICYAKWAFAAHAGAPRYPHPVPPSATQSFSEYLRTYVPSALCVPHLHIILQVLFEGALHAPLHQPLVQRLRNAR